MVPRTRTGCAACDGAWAFAASENKAAANTITVDGFMGRSGSWGGSIYPARGRTGNVCVAGRKPLGSGANAGACRTLPRPASALLFRAVSEGAPKADVHLVVEVAIPR